MKLQKVTCNDPVERINLSLHQSTTDLVKQYQTYYKATYGDEIATSHLVEEILKGFISTDKDFAKYVATEAKPARVVTARLTLGGAKSDVPEVGKPDSVEVTLRGDAT